MIRKLLVKLFTFAIIVTTAFGFQAYTAHADEDITFENPFTDVLEDAYYYDAVLWAVENGITNGVSENLFGVEQTCTRAQGITFLWRAEDSITPDLKELPFEDITRQDYFYDAVRWAVQEQIALGTTATTFAPDAELTRGQFITFLWRTLGSPAPETTDNPFTDIAEDDYYYDAVLWAVENGITSGTTPTTFAPDESCMRVQVVTFLLRSANIEAEEGGGEEETPDEDKVIIEDPSIPVNAADYGLSPENPGYDNSTILQQLIDTLAETGGTIYIPAGEYEFAEIGTQTIGSHCVKMHSNITIKGDGETTILKPTGQSYGGLDMFYFNEYVDTGEPIYLENCNFEDFVIDSANTHCRIYTSAGKGFMFNLFKDCNWKNVTVMNTDGTGFGVDCPIGGSMENCIAINCGKAATGTSPGASGFGIGFGYSEEECFTITNCEAYGNKAFGVFFEHQGRFNAKKYTADSAAEFMITDCKSTGSRYGFGGLLTMNTVYKNCVATDAQHHGYYFENSKNCTVLDCSSNNAVNASFVILQSGSDNGTQEVNNIIFENCIGNNSTYGAIIKNENSSALMAGNMILNCTFDDITERTIVAEGAMSSLVLAGNTSDQNANDITASIDHFVNLGNSWNMIDKIYN